LLFLSTSEHLNSISSEQILRIEIKTITMQEEKLLSGYSDSEKEAYITAVTCIATADRTASEEEMEFLEALTESAQLSEEGKQRIQHAATDVFGEDLKKSLDVLKGSDLRFSLITDLVAFAEADQNYSAEEKNNIEKIAQYLNVDQEQFSTINQFVKKSNEAQVAPEAVQQEGFLGSLGLEDKFKNSGLNFGSISKGLLGMIGPMLLGGLISRGLGGRRSGGMLGGGLLGGLGGMFGGMLGGGGGMLGGSRGGMLGGGGGLGSLIGMLGGGRGIGSTGGLFGRLLGRR
jgi:uncharacterized tellurite resistance protein B-like protein